MTDAQKNNIFFILHDQLMLATDAFRFEDIIKHFLWDELPMDRWANVNSIFTNKQPKYRQKMIYFVKLFADNKYFATFFTLQYEEKGEEFKFLKGSVR